MPLLWQMHKHTVVNLYILNLLFCEQEGSFEAVAWVNVSVMLMTEAEAV